MKATEYTFRNLCCASCSAKIENLINAFPQVRRAHIEYETGRLDLTVTDGADLDALYQDIAKLEKTVTCKEKLPEIYILEGLDCAECAAKIERKLKTKEGIADVTVNFSTKQLKIIYKDAYDPKAVFEQAKRIILDEEPDARVLKEETEKASFINFNTLRLLAGILLFIGALVIGNLVLYIAAYLVLGERVIIKALRNILRGHIFDENFLMFIATAGALALGEYSEAGAVMLFYEVGELFQDAAVNRSRRSIKSLLSQRPETVNIIEDGQIISKPAKSVPIGSLMSVVPGERIALDGVIVSGTGSVDMKALTGESLPVNVGMNDEVLSGTINLNGRLTVRTTKTESESAASKILEMVENASGKKAKTEEFITRFARYYTPAVTLAALLLALLPPLLIPGEAFNVSLSRAFVFLVISCPCALVISIPLGYFGGIGLAAKNGILVKGGNFLEALNHIEIAVFDKTGTLSRGNYTVTEVNPIGISKADLLQTAAAAQRFSTHPVAKAVVAACSEIPHYETTDLHELAGRGMSAKVKGEMVRIGNASYLKEAGIRFSELSVPGSVLYVSINGEYKGNIVIADEMKTGVKEALAQLKCAGVKKTVMLTGDKKEAALLAAQAIGIDEYASELLPAEKLSRVEALLKTKSPQGKLCYTGDGINDTPVLALADIGIAMGGLGADAAVEASDIVIMNDDIKKITVAKKIAKRTQIIVWENIIFALTIKFIFLLFGALGFATMWEAVFADVGVALIAIMNSIRILNDKKV